MVLRKAIKHVCLTALFAALGTVTVLAADAGQASGTNVNVRAEASTGADVLGKINKGTEFEILDKDGSWFEISYNGNSGFVSKDYFEVTKADFRSSRFADFLHQFCKNVAGEITAAPVEEQRLFLADRLDRSLFHVLQLGKGQLRFFVEEAGVVGCRRDGVHSFAMVTVDLFVAKVEVVITDQCVGVIFRAHSGSVFADLVTVGQGIIEGAVQVIPGLFQLDQIPGVTVFDTVVGIGIADDDDAGNIQPVAQDFHGFGDPFADADTLAQSSDDFMGVGLF